MVKSDQGSTGGVHLHMTYHLASAFSGWTILRVSSESILKTHFQPVTPKDLAVVSRSTSKIDALDDDGTLCLGPQAEGLHCRQRWLS